MTQPRRICAALALVLSLVFTPTAFANDDPPTATSSAPQGAQPGTATEFTIAPYMLFPTMSGTTTIRGLPLDVDLGPGEIFENLEFGIMGYFQVRRGKWGFSFDGLYMDLEKEATFEGPIGTAGATLSMGQSDPGELQVFLETEGHAVPRALEVVVQELRLLQTKQVPAAELGLAKDSLLAASMLLFESAEKTAGRFAKDVVLGRPHAYWSSYRGRIGRVTAADVQRVARAYLQPDQLVILLVGRWSDLAAGESALKRFGGRITHLPERDPLTLERVESQAPKTTQAP